MTKTVYRIVQRDSFDRPKVEHYKVLSETKKMYRVESLYQDYGDVRYMFRGFCSQLRKDEVIEDFNEAVKTHRVRTETYLDLLNILSERAQYYHTEFAKLAVEEEDVDS